ITAKSPLAQVACCFALMAEKSGPTDCTSPRATGFSIALIMSPMKSSKRGDQSMDMCSPGSQYRRSAVRRQAVSSRLPSRPLRGEPRVHEARSRIRYGPRHPLRGCCATFAYGGAVLLCERKQRLGCRGPSLTGLRGGRLEVHVAIESGEMRTHD